MSVTQPTYRTASNTSSTEQMTSEVNMYSNVYGIIFFIVHPTIAVIGIISNTCGLVVFVKDGLHKSSTIFLASLTLADSMTLLNALNPTILIYLHLAEDFTIKYAGWPHSYHIALFILTLDQIMFFCVWLGLYVSLTLQPVITVERFLAVYFPLKFKRIMSSKNAKAIVLIVYLLWVPWILFYVSCYTFQYTSSGLVTSEHTEFCSTHWDTIQLWIYSILNNITTIVPLVIVLLGSLLICIKVAQTTRKRRKMSTNHRSGTIRATRTLLTISLIFLVVNFTYFIVPICLGDRMENDWQFYVLVNISLEILQYVGSSSNFYVYIFLNKKYKSLFLDFFRVRVK